MNRTLEDIKTNHRFHGKKYSDFVDSGFVKTCDELVIDLKILGQLADLLSGVDEEVLPLLMKSLEPILPGSF